MIVAVVISCNCSLRNCELIRKKRKKVINSGLQRDSKCQQRKETSNEDPLSTHIYPGDFYKMSYSFVL